MKDFRVNTSHWFTEDGMLVVQASDIDSKDHLIPDLSMHNVSQGRLGQKIIFICFSGTPKSPSTLPTFKIFIPFPVFTLKNHLYVTNCQFKLAVICCHFVCLFLVGWLITNWFAAHTKCRKFLEITRIHGFIAFYSKK